MNLPSFYIEYVIVRAALRPMYFTHHARRVEIRAGDRVLAYDCGALIVWHDNEWNPLEGGFS